jgi:CheY-like chemotaxis protein
METTKTILVVEDKEQVRSVILETLEHLGYAVLEAADGTRALELAADHDGPIDLLLADIVMPGMHGDEVARQFQGIRPQAKVLFMSGYTTRSTAEQLKATAGASFIAKPFSLPELTDTLRKVLEA